MPMLILLECENLSDYVSTSQVLMMSIELFHLVANKAIAMQQIITYYDILFSKRSIYLFGICRLKSPNKS